MIIVKGNSEELEKCVDIIFDSEMGKKYYPTRKSLLAEVEKGIIEDEFYVTKNFEGKIVGVLWYQKKGIFHSFPYLHVIAVSNDVQNQGIGTKLLDFFEEEAIKSGNFKAKVFLTVGDFNGNAERLYQNRGYIKVGEIEGLFRRNITERLYMKVITGNRQVK